MTTTEKVLYERRLEKMFDMLLLGMTNEEIASHLQITIRAVQNYKRKLESRYMQYQQQKNENTWALEFTLLKNRLLTLYRNLDRKIADPRTSTADAAKAVDVASHLALTIHNAETEGMQAIKGMVNLVKSQEAIMMKKGESNTLELDDGPVTINWNQLDNEQKRMIDYKRYDHEQNAKF